MPCACPCCPAAMTVAGARNRTSIAHSAIFLNMVFHSWPGVDRLIPVHPSPSNHRQGLSNLFPDSQLHIHPPREQGNEPDLRMRTWIILELTPIRTPGRPEKNGEISSVETWYFNTLRITWYRRGPCLSPPKLPFRFAMVL